MAWPPWADLHGPERLQGSAAVRAVGVGAALVHHRLLHEPDHLQQTRVVLSFTYVDTPYYILYESPLMQHDKG